MVYINRSECITSTQLNIIFTSRLFWRELTYWTRVYFNSVFFSIGSAMEVFAMLFSIPSSYAYMLRLILPRQVADRFRELFNQYIIILRELITAASNGQMDLVNEKIDDLNKNSADRAEFLSEIFPSLEKEVLEEMFNTFARDEIEEINAYITGDYTRVIEIYDNLIAHGENIADYISMGIIDLITAAPKAERFAPAEDICITYDELNIILDIAMFWIDLMAWFRAYRISVMADIGSREELYERLIRHINDFGNLMKIFTDPEIIEIQIILLQEYINIMDRVLESRMSGDIEEMNRAFQESIDNINERAEFLSAVFPGHNEEEWKNQLIRWNSDLIEMGGAFLSGDYARNIMIFDGLINLAEDMGFIFINALFDVFSDENI